MKKIMFVLTTFLLAMTVSVTTQAADVDYNQEFCSQLDAFADAQDVKIGMITDSGTIDDKSFNQGTWEGIKCYEDKHDLSSDNVKYVQPAGESKQDYLDAIANLVGNDYEIIVTPGFKFEQAIFEAQTQYPDVHFILIDGTPNPGDYSKAEVKDNTVSVFFAEHQAGFLAGVASALETKTGKLGFVGGMEIPPVQKFGYGFVAGVAYANNELGTNATVVDYVYEGTFDNVSGGQTIAAGMYDKGIDIIFHAAGGVGAGVINEAKTRAEGNDEVYVVGVDSNQYADGIYDEANNKSVILTSALKRVDVGAYDNIGKYATNSFPGGETITLDITNNGVGLPAVNPNLADTTITQVDTVKTSMIDGDVNVPANNEDLLTFLEAQGYETPENVEYVTVQDDATDGEGGNTGLIVGIIALVVIVGGAVVYSRNKNK